MEVDKCCTYARSDISHRRGIGMKDREIRLRLCLPDKMRVNVTRTGMAKMTDVGRKLPSLFFCPLLSKLEVMNLSETLRIQ